MVAQFQGVIEEFVEHIRDGNFDEQIDYLIRQLQIRKESLLTSALTVGARVHIAASCRPKYLCFAKGTIQGIEGSKYVVRLDRQIGRYSQTLRVEASLLVPE